MRSIVASAMEAGGRHLNEQIELRTLAGYADAYQRHINQLERAAERGDNRSAKLLARAILRSHAGRVCCLLRVFRAKPEQPSLLTMADLDRVASTLNPFRPIRETVRVKEKSKDSGAIRQVVSFGWKRRALQKMCGDILETLYPAIECDYLREGRGADAATLRLKELIEEGGYTHVVTVDVRNCFGSAKKGEVARLLPLPDAVVHNVLLISDGDEVTHTPTSDEANGGASTGDP